MCSDLKIVAKGFPTIDALHILDDMGMLGCIIDGSVVTSGPDRRDIEIAIARGMMLGKKLDDLADDVRSMRAELQSQKIASIYDSLDRIAALNAQMLMDDKAWAEQRERDEKARLDQRERDE